MPTNSIEKHLKQTGLLWLITLTGLVAVLAVGIALYYFISEGRSQGWALSREPSSYIDFGLFIGALITPLVAVVSLVIFWQTLRLQMIELVKSAKSLEQTASANTEIISQNEKLFKLKVLYQRLSKQFDEIQEVKSLELIAYNEDGGVNQMHTGNPVSFNITNSISKPKVNEQMLTMLKNSKNAKVFDEYTFKLMSYAADALEYLELGGRYGHIQRQVTEILDLIKPFKTFALINKLQNDRETANRAETLANAHDALEQLSFKGMNELSVMLSADP